MGRSAGFQPSRSAGFTGADGNTDRPSVIPGKVFGLLDDWDPATGIYDASALQVNEAGFFGTAGLNVGRNPGVANFDISLIKDTALGERANLQFRAEFFNIFNRTNFDLPNRVAFSGSYSFDESNGDVNGRPNSRFGTMTTTNTTSRQIQLALKLSF
jgi:hypothetical protein